MINDSTMAEAGNAKHNIQIRFNTEREKVSAAAKPWRVLIDGVEYLAKDVRVEVPMWTTEDLLPTGQKKWHLSCQGEAVWDEPGGNCLIR